MTEGSLLKEIFNDAVELPEAERPAFLDRACAGKPELRKQVEQLLAAYSGAPQFMAAPTAQTPETMRISSAPGAAPAVGEGPGEQIDAYKLVQLIGEGGFGSVFLAEQTEPVRRRVALKIIKLGMDTRQVIARFEAERQALAIMQHPNIAQVYDAGATDTGRPYFVMELVHGEAITTYCDRHNLSIEERLELFQQVCHAVQHAHQKGIIHRDIKPSNVLVTTADGKAIPKVIDFGIAKATNARLTEKTHFTENREIIGTPEYMSPEQAGPLAADIDTRTDIYSLGVLLYELLTGALPFDATRLRGAAFAEIERIIREEEPPKPSARLSTLETLPSVAARRQTEPARLNRLVRGDLDWIVMMCLEKDRSRRYPSASGLAQDVQRYLSGEPVLAAPPSPAYRLRKFVRRNKVAVLSSALIVVALALGVIGTTIGMIRAVAEARRADAEAERARMAEADATQRSRELEQVAEFQASQLAGIDTQRLGTTLRAGIIDDWRKALQGQGPEGETIDAAWRPTQPGFLAVNFTNVALEALRENIFDRALGVIERDFADQPLVKARLLQTVAETLRELGLVEAATQPQVQALEIRRDALGDDHPDSLTCLNSYATLLQAQGKFQDAEPQFRDALDKRRSVLGEDHPDTLSSMNNLGLLLQKRGQHDEAEQLLLEALQKRRTVLGEEHPTTLSTINNLGLLLHERGRLADAEPYRRESLEKSRRVLGENHRYTANAISNMAALLESQGRYSEAEPLRREALEKYRRLLGDDHSDTLAAINNLAGMFVAQGRLAEAEPLLQQVLDVRRRTLSPEHPSLLTSINNLGAVLLRQDRLAEAEPFLREALELRRRTLGEEHPHTMSSLNGLGSLYRLQGRLAEAEQYLQDAAEKRRRILGDDHPETINTVHNLAILRRDQGRLDEADALGAEATERARRVLGPDHETLGTILSHHGATLLASQRFANAERNYVEAHAIMAGKFGPDHKRTIEQINALAELYDAWHEADPAAGHDAQAAQWRSRLPAQSSNEPATRPSAP